jgi:hypothetical protein
MGPDSEQQSVEITNGGLDGCDAAEASTDDGVGSIGLGVSPLAAAAASLLNMLDLTGLIAEDADAASRPEGRGRVMGSHVPKEELPLQAGDVRLVRSAEPPLEPSKMATSEDWQFIEEAQRGRPASASKERATQSASDDAELDWERSPLGASYDGGGRGGQGGMDGRVGRVGWFALDWV